MSTKLRVEILTKTGDIEYKPGTLDEKGIVTVKLRKAKRTFHLGDTMSPRFKKKPQVFWPEGSGEAYPILADQIPVAREAEVTCPSCHVKATHQLEFNVPNFQSNLTDETLNEIAENTYASDAMQVSSKRSRLQNVTQTANWVVFGVMILLLFYVAMKTNTINDYLHIVHPPPPVPTPGAGAGTVPMVH